MFVRARHDRDIHPSLTPGHEYYVIGIEAEDFRLINDKGEPFLYAPDMFAVNDPNEPENWINEVGLEGERYAYPPPLNEVGFFEDYHDGLLPTRAEFWRVINRLMCLAERKV